MSSNNVFIDVADLVNVPRDVAREAHTNLASGRVVGLAMSGKLASGKDTVAPAALSRLGMQKLAHLYFAQPIKDEMDEMFTVMRQAESQNHAVVTIAQQMDLPYWAAEELVAGLWVPVLSDLTLHARSRTVEVRRALQYLGTDVRRSQDPDFWVKRSLQQALLEMAAGSSVFFTDARFPNEVDAMHRIGFVVVRLEITAETQRKRLAGRDGMVPDQSAVNHPSEVALDNFDNFDVRVSNDGPVEIAIAATLEALAATTAARKAA